MNGPARPLMFCLLVLCAGNTAYAQPSFQPTLAPTVTAETEHWYQVGEPVILSGDMYYPAGAQVYFNADEMVSSGSYKGVPLYSLIGSEPFSIVFVPLRDGLMQPYQRRRTVEIAGRTGTSAPSFPAAFPAPPIRFDDVTAASMAAPVSMSGHPVMMSPVGRPVRVAAARAARPAARRPQSPNGVFVEFDAARWFSSGRPTPFDPKTFKQVGELHGLPVYAMPGRVATIFVPVAEGLNLVAPYSKRDR